MAEKKLSEIGPWAGYKHAMNISDALAETWPAKLARSAYKAFMLPGDVYSGKTQLSDIRTGHTNQDVIERSADLSGLVTLGSGALPAKASELRAGIRAYHGSPHDFDKFDMSKIGTGEGAQAYGHGLYFSEHEGVAKSYRDDLSKTIAIGDSPILKNNKKIGTTGNKELDDIILSFEMRGGTMDDVVGLIKNQMRDPNARNAKRYAEMLPLAEEAQRAGMKVDTSGKMYEVSINAHPDEFLDWDKPLSEQSPKVQEVLRGLDILPGERGTPPEWLSEATGYDKWVNTGQSAYDDLSVRAGYGVAKHPIGAVEQLRAAGIKGIRYKDAGSRGADKAGGTHNYVVFDDKIIDILKKYGIAGLTAGVGGAAMMGQPGKAQAGDFMFRPFNAGEFRDNGDGTRSTELERGVSLPDGSIANVPSLWKNAQSGKTVDLGKMSDDQLGAFAARYEAATGQQFPRFKSFDEATSTAKKRSAGGGRAQGPLAQPWTKYAPQKSGPWLQYK